MVKITDVARHANVSPSTVSYALSGKRPISPETRRRIEDSIRELGYRPHAGARSLASSRSRVIGLVLPLRKGIHVPVVMQFATSVLTAAREHDHDVLLLTQNEGEEGINRVAQSAMADAFIIMDVETDDRRLPLLRVLDKPSVLIGFPSDTAGLTCVDLDFAGAGEACVEHLAGLGHRTVALVGSPPEVYVRGTGFARRVAAGFTAAADRLGLRSSVHPCPETPAAAGHGRATAARAAGAHRGRRPQRADNPASDLRVPGHGTARPGGSLRRRDLPRRDRRAGTRADHVGLDPLRRDRHQRGGAPDGQARRPRRRPGDDRALRAPDPRATTAPPAVAAP